MDYNTAKTLLERYFAGATSIAEEAQLRQYFQQAELPEDMLPYRPLFRYFTAAQQETTDAAFTERIRESSTKKHTAKRIRLRPGAWSFVGAAAMVLLAMAVWFFAPVNEIEQTQTAIDWSQYEPKNEEEAVRITTAAFRKTSASLRLGLEAATNELKTVKKIVQPF